jgi:hypothetical protein
MPPRGLPRNISDMTSGEPQGWYEDPFRLHEARYFSGGRPTKLVRNGDLESYDEPPSEGVPGSAAAPWDHAVSEAPNRAEAKGLNPPGDDVPPFPRRRPRAGVLTAVAVVAIAGVVTAAVLVGKPRPATVPVTEAMAYTATLNAGSARVDVIYALTTGNHKFDVTAKESGPVSWSADQGDLAATTTAGPLLMTMRQIIDGRKTYSKISKFEMKGLPASALSGIPGVDGWSETTWTGASSSPDLSGILPSLLLWGGLFNPSGMASPASLLGLLRAQASSVQDLGGEVLDGVNTTHYRALIPLSRLGAGTTAELQQAEQELGTNVIGVDYWIDSSDLLRQLRLVITVPRQPAPTPTTSSPGEVTDPFTPTTSSPGEVIAFTYPVTLSVSLGLSHYGTPVDVVPPPSAQITSQEACVVTNDGFTCSS